MDAKQIVFNTVAGSTLLTDLKGYWKLTEASGSTFDDSYGANNGTGVGTVAHSTGVEFDTQTDYLYVVGNSSLYPTNSFSISLWFNLDTLPSTQARNMFLIRYVDSTYTWSYESFIAYDAEGPVERIVFYLKDDTGANIQAESPTALLSTGTLYNLILVNEVGTYPHIYLNNVDRTNYHPTNFTGTILQPDDDLFFGSPSSVGLTSTIDGIVRDVAIWNKVLTSDERAEVYNSGTPNPYPFS